MRASDCQLWLIVLWTIGVFVTLLILGMQVGHELYGEHIHAVVGWCMQAFAPLFGTLLLKFTAARITNSRFVDRRVFVVACCVSALYLIGVNVLLSSTSEITKDQIVAEPAPAACSQKCSAECTYCIHSDSQVIQTSLVNKRLDRLEDYSLLTELALIPVGGLIVACLGKEPEPGP
jgi:polyferredoxin